MRHFQSVLAISMLVAIASHAEAATITLTSEVGTNIFPYGDLAKTTATTSDVVTGLTLNAPFNPDPYLSGLAKARGSFGPSGLVLGASQTLTAIVNNAMVSDSLDADSFAQFEDTVTVTGGSSGTFGTLDMDFAMDGNVSGFVSHHVGPFAEICSTVFSTFQPTGTATCHIPIVFDQPTLLTVILAAGVNIDFLLDFPGSTFSATADFYNTATLQSVAVLDANGNPIAGSVTSASGLVYPLATTPVPEPTTIALLGLGLAGTGARRWRKA